jgi:recombinational DNA repair protein RecR
MRKILNIAAVITSQIVSGVICANQSRNHQIICIVEDIRDVMAIENTGQFRGIYHVLGGKISQLTE